MKKIILTLFLAIMATTGLYAQQIALVSKTGATSVYQTLQKAIEGATAESTIYLPGGGFQIPDSVKIKKKITIVGVSHRGDTDNADGATTISGNLQFIDEASGSAVMGVYVSGNISVGDGVENVTIRYCNANSIQAAGSATDLVVNQCYLRNPSNFNGCNVRLENNILHSVLNVSGGIINHNVIVSRYNYYSNYCNTLYQVQSSSITNNIFTDWNGHSGGDCYASNNCIGAGSWGENPVTLDEGKTWADVFVAHNGVVISSDYHLKGTWGKGEATDGSDIGIFGGTGFSDEALAPIPYIVAKRVDAQTDASGMLNVKIRVKAGGSE